MEKVKNYSNYWTKKFFGDGYGNTKINSIVVKDSNNVTSMLNSVANLSTEEFVQCGLYGLFETAQPEKIDDSTTENMRMMSVNCEFIALLTICYQNKNLDPVSGFTNREKSKETEISEFLVDHADEFNTIIKRMETVKSKPGKMKFGSTYLFYLVMILSCFSFITSVNADSCCSLSLSGCPFSDNRVDLTVVVDSNNVICQSYLKRYVSDVNGTHTNIDCTSTLIDPSQCIHECSTGCSGNSQFCSMFNCNGNRCNCQAYNSTEVLKCIGYEDEELELEGHYANLYCFTQNIQEFKKRGIISCPQMDIVTDKDFVYATIPSDFNQCIAYASKDIWSYQAAFLDPNMIIKIDQSAKTKSGTVDIKVICSNVQCFHTTSYLDYTVDCVIVNSWYPGDVYSNLNCLPASYQAAFTLSVIALVLAGIALCPCTWVIIYSLWRCCMFPSYCCWPIMNNYYLRMKNKLDDLHEREYGDDKTIDESSWKRLKSIKSNPYDVEKGLQYNNVNFSSASNPNDEPKRNKTTIEKFMSSDNKVPKDSGSGNSSRERSERAHGSYVHGTGNNILYYNTIIFVSTILLSLSLVSSQCVSTPPISVSQPSCVSTSASTEQCTFTFSTTVSIPFPGAKVCLTFKDDNSKLIGNINMTYINRTDIGTLTTRYYTGLWVPLASSFHGCYNNGWCDDSCASASSRTMYGFDSTIAQYPGQTYCRRSCGCAACGCFYCVGGCVVSGYSIKYTSAAMAVADITKLSYNYYFAMDYDNTHSEWNQNLGSTTVGPFKADFVGSFQGDTTYFGTKNVIFNSTHQYFGEACEANSPIQQQVGDLQASSLSNLQNKNYIFDTNIVNSIPQDKSTTYIFANPGMNNIGVYPKFPVTYGTVWTYSTGQIKTKANNPGAVLIQLTSNNPVTLTRTKTIVCPEGEYISGSGCYNCDQGAVVRLKIRSTCSMGSIRLETSSEFAHTTLKSITITNSFAMYDIDITTSLQINNWNMLLITEQSTVSIPVSFGAVENITLRNDTFEVVPTRGDESGVGLIFPSWDNFLDNLSFNTNGFQWLYIIYVVIFCIIMIVIIYLLIKIIMAMCNNSGKYKST